MIDSYKHIFIDLDDTIWDFYANSKTALNEVYTQERLNRYFQSFDDFYKLYADYNKILWEKYGNGEVTKEFVAFERFRHPLSTVGVADDDLAERMNKQFLATLPTKTALKPYAKELLDYLKNSSKSVTLISNGFTAVQEKKMNSANLNSYFDHIIYSENVGALKPDKKIFEFALKLNQAQPSETVMIGDNYNADILGAINSGIDAIYLNNTTKKVTPHEKVVEIFGLDEILDVIKEK
ncbi:MAG: noncanonical pyrimidine nucleotidase, YjjG family [Paludibacter sp.]|nr:MAG: noncanonical pyrimidine nucleotidase, YjjG family [Paludibacter sp.]